MSTPVAPRSKSVTNSPLVTPKPKPSPSSISVSGSPRTFRTGRQVQKLLENEMIQQEMRKLLMDGQQKLIIIPTGGSGGGGGGGYHTVNGKFLTPQVKICSTNSSDSSDGKRTPPRRKRHHRQRHQNGGSNGGALATTTTATAPHHKTISKIYSWRPNAVGQNLKTPGDQYPSLRSLKTLSEEKRSTDATLLPASPSLSSFTCSDLPASSLRPLSDVVSVRSLISIGMGSTDGKKLVIRRVPTSPSDLLNFARSSP